jgi:hypothetical protein
MKRILNFVFFISIVQGLLAQNINKDSIIIKVKSCNRMKSKITVILENHTGKELIRANPMAPLQLFKWNGKEWMQVSQIGYCSCGMIPCPPPPEYMPFYVNEVLAFEWDQMTSRCVDMQKGTKEFKWSGRGKYKVVFEFKKEQYGESFQVEKTFKIR